MRIGCQDAYPATAVQAGMIFHALSGAHAGHYCEQAIIAIPELVDIDLFRAAWRRVVARHAVLRTSFDVKRAERPWQVVHTHAEIPIVAHDWRGLDRAEQLRRRDRLLAAERDAGFDLSAPPLVRASLCWVDEDESWLLPSFHHAVLDSHGSVIMLGEGFLIYRALREGQSLTLPEPEPFRRFVEWVEAQDAARAARFWRERLAGVRRPTPLPANATEAMAGEAGVRRQRVSAPVSRGLRELTARAGATLGVTLQAAWALTLAAETGERDVVFGLARAGRRSPPFSTDYMMGVTVTTVPTRARVDPERSLVDWLGELHRHAVAVREFEHTPALHVQRASDLEPGEPLFETLFSFEHGDQRAILCAIDPAWEERDFELIDRPSYPLTLKVSEAGEGLVVEVLFDGERVTASTAERVLGLCVRALSSLVAGPDATLGDLLAGLEEDAGVGVEPTPCLGGSTPYEREATIAQLFEAQADRAPDAVALELGERRMTYAQLDAAANRLAWRLRRLGVEPGELVGVALPRSLELVVTMLGVLKAGGAYLPLDVEHPACRSALMLADGGSRVLISRRELADALLDGDAQLLALEPNAPVAPGEPEERPAPAGGGGADDLAYVMYTSGSTGAPKGVETPNRGVVRLVRGADYVRLGPGEVHLQLASPAFDASTFEIWGALLNGGRLVIAPPEVPSLKALAEIVRAHGVTTLWLAAALFHEIVDFDPGSLRGLRQLLAGGDVVRAADVRRALMALPGCTVINGYGPTESTTFACAYAVADPDQVGASVPIGRPIANTYVRILDAQGQPVARGTAGELCIGGDGLARGYRGRPELTAERFVPDRLSGEPSARLYRTGDRARLRRDGLIEFLGRLDDQVKIRGVRVEPAEVEAVLAQHPDVAQAVIVASEAAGGERRLVAYLVPRLEARDSEIDPRDFLIRRLPAAMVPEAFVQVPALPRSANGKVDRRGLPAPPVNGSRRAVPIGPRTEVERQLAALWAQLLNVPQIGVRDDFFDAGGHSLLTMRLFAEIEERLGVNLPVASIFTAPTVEGLARLVESKSARDHWRSLVPVAARVEGRPLFCVHGAGGEIALFAELGRRMGATRPFYGLQAQGLDGRTDVLATVEEMAAHYVAEVRSVQPTGPYLLAGMCMGGLVAFEMAQQLHASGETVAFLGVIDSPGPRETEAQRAPIVADGNGRPTASGRDPRPVRRADRDARRRAKRRARSAREVGWIDLARGFWWRPLKALRRGRRALDKWRDRRVRAWRRWRKRSRRATKQQWQWLKRALVGRRVEDRSLLERSRNLARQLHPDEVERRRRRVEVTNRAAQRSYVATPYPGRVTVLHCEESVSHPHRRRYAGWESAAGGGIDHVVVPGTHHTMLRPPAVQALAEVLLDRLDEAERRHAAPSGSAPARSEPEAETVAARR